jgi:dephospho-CoA kinase
MLTVGLTGGIGSGKSTVAALFAAHGVPVIDTDVISRKVADEPAIIAAVRDAFGDEVIGADGQLDRRQLAYRVFGSPIDRARLEQLLHPRIREQVAIEREAYRDRPYVIIAVPLLLETDFHTLVDRILVVDAGDALRIARVQARDGRDERAIRAIMASQIGRDERLARADDIIDNNGDSAALGAQVDALHRQYLGVATG